MRAMHLQDGPCKHYICQPSECLMQVRAMAEFGKERSHLSLHKGSCTAFVHIQPFPRQSLALPNLPQGTCLQSVTWGLTSLSFQLASRNVPHFRASSHLPFISLFYSSLHQIANPVDVTSMIKQQYRG